MIQAFVAWGPAVLWAAVLFFLSAQPEFPGGFDLSVNDKLVHGLLYLVLGAALAWGATRGPRASHALLLVLGGLYAASDEWHQSFVPGRDPSLGDLLADGVGLLAGYSLVLHLGRSTSST